jgi:hypothetical protein
MVFCSYVDGCGVSDDHALSFIRLKVCCILLRKAANDVLVITQASSVWTSFLLLSCDNIAASMICQAYDVWTIPARSNVSFFAAISEIRLGSWIVLGGRNREGVTSCRCISELYDCLVHFISTKYYMLYQRLCDVQYVDYSRILCGWRHYHYNARIWW